MSATASWNDLQAILTDAQKARAQQDEMRAHTLYVRATQLDPNNATAWAGRAAMSLDSDDSIVSWGYALSLSPQDENARTVLVQHVQDKIAASGPGDVDELIELGRDLAEAGQKSSAHQLFVRTTQLAEKNATAWVWRAGSADSTDETVMCLHRALILDPENRKAQSGLEWILTNKFAPSQFASPAMMRQAAKHLAEGQQLVRSGKRAEAHESFVHATEQDHNNQAAWLWRASTTQDADQALVCIEQALRLNPKNAMAMEARKFLIARIQGDQPKPIAPVGEPVAPTLMPEITSAPNSNVHLLLLAIATVLLILLIYILLRNLQLVP